MSTSMKILLLTTINDLYQEDYFELTILHGLRSLLGDRLIDVPRKSICYHDFYVKDKESLHGRGFTLLRNKFPDIPQELRDNYLDYCYDAVIVGQGHVWGEDPSERLSGITAKAVWILDGHDLYGQAPRLITHKGRIVIGSQYANSFKRELVEELPPELNVYPSGFGIPIETIRPINLSLKNQLFPRTVPSRSVFGVDEELGSRRHHVFHEEDEYFDDISRSWFGLTCMKGGWDALRHYEIIAAGTLLLFRDLKDKPKFCSPQNLPAPSYSSPEELNAIVHSLLPNGVPSEDYQRILTLQREWLISNGTTVARALDVVRVILKHLSKS